MVGVSPAYFADFSDVKAVAYVEAHLMLEAADFACNYAKKIKEKYQKFDKNPLKVNGKVIEVKRIDINLLDKILCRIFTFGKALPDQVFPNPINQVSLLTGNKPHKFAYYGDFLVKKDDLVELDIYQMSRINEFEEFKRKVLRFIEVNPFPDLIKEYNIKDTMKLGFSGEDYIIRLIKEVPKTKLQNLEGIITNYRIIRSINLTN